MTDSIQKYLSQLKKLRRAPSKLGLAPHKPVLLISIISLIRENIIETNRIFITTKLVAAFKTNWSLLVDTEHTSNFSLPFFHLRSEPFWKLSYLQPHAASIKSINTINVLKNFVAFAEIDTELFLLLKDPINNRLMEDFLLDTYFPNTKNHFKKNQINSGGIVDEMKNDILHESPEIYQTKIDVLYAQLSETEIEEDRFMRGSVFKREVPKVYNYTCAISGMKIDLRDNIQMVDACHIIPFSLSKDDTITNGICLSPNLHRAYDRGLITINDNYIVRVAPDLKENESVFSLRQFEGKTIHLPHQQHFYPSLQNLAWHRKERFIL
jgi:putative restriction endonuclease